MTALQNGPHRWAATAMSVVLSALLPVVPAAAQTCPFDDGNSQLTREGLVLTRYALGLTGSALVNGTDFLPADAPTIQSSIACPSCGLNITGNTDGLGNPVVTVADATIISRKLAGMSGAALTNGVNLGAGTRNTTSAVNSFLLAGCGATGGTVTSVGSGTGLTGGPITTSGTLALATTYRLPQGCAANAVAKYNTGTGTWDCATDNSGAGGGTVTSITAGTGLTGGTITTTGTVAADTTYLQRRVSSSCAAGSSIRAINVDGTVVCQTDSTGPANAFVQGGNSFGAAAVLGLNDAQPLSVQTAGSQISLTIAAGNGLRVQAPSAAAQVNFPDAPNVVNGSRLNAALDTYAGVTMSGGGGGLACDDPPTGPSATRACAHTVTGSYATISGGNDNRAADYAAVGGGYANTASGSGSVIGGGQRNTTTGSNSTVGGGSSNTASGSWATIAGGNGSTAVGNYGAVGGGFSNDATATYSTVSGGSSNAATGSYAMVPGGQHNEASGANSFAAGFAAKARGSAMFVWADGQSGGFDPALSGSFGSSNANVTPLNNTFIVRATGGVQFATGINGSGVITQSCFIGPAGTGWSCASDRNLKHLIKEVSPKDILARLMTVPVSTWAFKGFEMRQLGPMAQDFHRAFGLGDSDRHINSVDAQGVAFAAIQGLHQVVQDKDREIAALKRDRDASQASIQTMKAELAAIRKHLRM